MGLMRQSIVTRSGSSPHDVTPARVQAMLWSLKSPQLISLGDVFSGEIGPTVNEQFWMNTTSGILVNQGNHSDLPLEREKLVESSRLFHVGETETPEDLAKYDQKLMKDLTAMGPGSATFSLYNDATDCLRQF